MLLCSTIGADTDCVVSHVRVDVIMLLLGDSCALLSCCGLEPLLINLHACLAPFPCPSQRKAKNFCHRSLQAVYSADVDTCSPAVTVALHIKNKSSNQLALTYRFLGCCTLLMVMSEDQIG